MLFLFILEVVATLCHIYLSFEVAEVALNKRRDLLVWLGFALGWGKNLKISLIFSSLSSPDSSDLLPTLVVLVVFISMFLHLYLLSPFFFLEKDIDDRTDRWVVRVGLFISIFTTLVLRVFWLNVLLTTR